MQLVRQKEKSAVKRYRPGSVVLAALLAAAVVSGCAAETGGDGSASSGGPAKPAAGQQGGDAPQAGPARALDTYAQKLRRKQAARAVAAKKWGLSAVPLAAPEPPRTKPRITTRDGFEVQDDEGLPPVFTTVPTKERIVFLTMDDGAEKDPELLRMMTELDIPYSAFLSDYVINDDYGYFAKMQKRGVTLSNHTLNHRYLPGLSRAEQKSEICDQQDKLQKRYGKRPTLFRPPYGNYNRDTLVVAGSCGITAVPLWASEAFPDHMEWREWDRDLHPGDIVLTHFRGKEDWKGTMPDMIRQVMKTITDKGYAVARLEDYV
ncbi:Peptidoglycan-N-acetylmuramic acid deacetylase PdaC [Streptomyces sp. ADI96-02]|uniref:polysaccharide deacetylase family protein n=1 Tax=unclassified Streptomyces TaxID=2593676 RepID=UPI000F55109B|nr:polysaccharide deacetylase family protein [Streptomyces sp. ADI96-02]RPK59951.1 Peptidoglycan-N-acetylmuramic acid deacetylase PdaC [Streptomyces sp. ADI96-02]